MRETVDSGSLAGIFNLPEGLKNRKIEVIILPTANDNHQMDLPTEVICEVVYVLEKVYRARFVSQAPPNDLRAD